MHINFSDIPNSQNLFLDYLYEFDNVAKFYTRNFRNTEKYPGFFEMLSEQKKPHRDKLIEIIKKQYSEYSPSKQTELNINALSSGKTFAVVTGQQLGLFGGPMYTLYKSITTIKLCNHLKEQYDGYQFVPVFWLEGDDHDFDEVRAFNVFNDDNVPYQISYSDGLDEETNRGNVAEIKFNENIENVYRELDEKLRNTEFKNDVLDLVKKYYKKDVPFVDAFRDLLYELFDDYGLVIFNPRDTEIKKLLIPIFEKEILDFRNHSRSLVERSAELEDTYHAQVKVKPINLFYTENNERLLVEPVDEEFRLKGKRKKITKDELLEMIHNDSSNFSPNVLLRPICQDYLFPTAFYVGGPSEISYFAQASLLYDHYDLIQPYIYPRSSATVVEKNIKNVLDKYNLEYTDIFMEENALTTKVLNEISDIDLDRLFEDSRLQIREVLQKISDDISSIEKTMENVADKSLQRIEQTLDTMKDKSQNAEKRRHEATVRQLKKARNILYPNNTLQEREVNFIYFAHKYGLDILKWIYNEISINKFEHQIIEM